jgi:hypothetical protein
MDNHHPNAVRLEGQIARYDRKSSLKQKSF